MELGSGAAIVTMSEPEVAILTKENRMIADIHPAVTAEVNHRNRQGLVGVCENVDWCGGNMFVAADG